MKIISKLEAKMVTGQKSCLCRCRQFHTENHNQSNWYNFNGKKYEDIVVGHASNIKECIEICNDMMPGNLFKSCLTLTKKTEGWGKSGAFAERKSEL